MQVKKVNGVRSNRMLGVILAVVLFFSVAAFPQDGNCTEKPAEIKAVVIDSGIAEVTAEIFISNAVPAAGNLELTYDTDFFTAKEVSPGTLLNEVPIFGSNLNEPGIIRISWADPMATDGKGGADGLLLRITFLKEKEQPLVLNCTKVELIRADGSFIPFMVKGEGLKSEDPSSRAREIHLQIGIAEAWVNGSPVTLNAAPFLKEGRTMVPVRFISEHFGAKVSWLRETNQVRIEDGRQVILLTIDTPSALVNGVEEELDCAAVIVNGTTFVPLRFVSTILGAGTLWDSLTQSIDIIRF